jgi:hypothetical protein
VNPEHPLVEAAILIWSHDLPISTDHWEHLAELGFEVPALERQYRP